MNDVTTCDYGCSMVTTIGHPYSEREAEASFILASVETHPADYLGIDIGFIYPAVDSDGQIWRWANRKQRHPETAEAGPVRVRKVDGSSYVADPYAPDELNDIFARAETTGQAERIRALASSIVAKAKRSDRGLALEDYDEMRLRRTTSSWLKLHQSILVCANARGLETVTVERAYTSQRCPECGHTSKANRPRRSDFACVRCGFQGHNDKVAARNVRALAVEHKGKRRTAAVCSNPDCRKPQVFRAGVCCSCYFWKRRHGGELPDCETLERLNVARNYSEFRRTLLELE